MVLVTLLLALERQLKYAKICFGLSEGANRRGSRRKGWSGFLVSLNRMNIRHCLYCADRTPVPAILIQLRSQLQY